MQITVATLKPHKTALEEEYKAAIPKYTHRAQFKPSFDSVWIHPGPTPDLPVEIEVVIVETVLRPMNRCLFYTIRKDGFLWPSDDKDGTARCYMTPLQDWLDKLERQ
jgi:hypothetical protein